ncbi:hypothetical protein CR513_33880, partial [Mucuna pruriens]
MPIDEVQMVGQVLNTFIAWPKSFVKIVSTMIFIIKKLLYLQFKFILVSNMTLMDQRRKLQPKSSQAKVRPIQHCLWKVVSQVGGSLVQLKLDVQITSKNSTIPLYLCQKGISINSIGSEHLYGFIKSLLLQTIGPQSQMFFLCPQDNVIVFICSLGHNGDKEIHKILDKLKNNLRVMNVVSIDNATSFLAKEIDDI